MEMANYQQITNCCSSLALFALFGALALPWYEQNAAILGHSMVQIGVGSITAFVALLSILVTYYTDGSMRESNCYRKCVYFLSSAQILATSEQQKNLPDPEQSKNEPTT